MIKHNLLVSSNETLCGIKKPISDSAFFWRDTTCRFCIIKILEFKEQNKIISDETSLILKNRLYYQHFEEIIHDAPKI